MGKKKGGLRRSEDSTPLTSHLAAVECYIGVTFPSGKEGENDSGYRFISADEGRWLQALADWSK